ILRCAQDDNDGAQDDNDEGGVTHSKSPERDVMHFKPPLLAILCSIVILSTIVIPCTIVILSAAKDLLPRLLLDSIGRCVPILPQCGRTFRNVTLPAAPRGPALRLLEY